MKVTDRRLLVAAATRSGTSYTTKLLRGIDLQAGHEKWPQNSTGGDGCFVGYTFILENPTDYKCIFHQVRDPIKAIASSATHQPDVFTKIYKRLKLPKLKQPCIRCKAVGHLNCRAFEGKDYVCEQQILLTSRCWLAVNERAEEISSWRYKIEDIREVFPEICSRLKIRGKSFPDNILINSRVGSYIQFDYADISSIDKELGKKIIDKAEQYGYDTSRPSGLVVGDSLEGTISADSQ